MKSSAALCAEVERRLKRTWHLDIAQETTSWPFDLVVGQPDSATLSNDFPGIQRSVAAIRDWARAHDLSVRDANRRVFGTTQPLPSHITIPGLHVAAAVCGPEWVARIERAEGRLDRLGNVYPTCTRLSTVLRSVDAYTDRDFELLLTVTDWFASHSADGLTPRQVPVPGVHAKWLNTHTPVIEILLGRRLNLAGRHPARIHFAYLDPEHLASAGRRFDSATVGDAAEPVYRPTVVVITENKDTAIHFPPIRRGIAIEGAGFGGLTVASFEWVLAADVVYWGDLDSAGFEILDGYRRDGVPARSLLMDLKTYVEYAAWGTYHDAKGERLRPSAPKPLETLTEAEREVYHVVCSQAAGPPRIEQERIPLDEARAALLALVS